VPLFDFVCRACQHEFEALVRPGHPPACPKCQGVDLEQKLPSFAVKTAERSAANAAASRHRYAVEGQKETAIREAEAEAHRREDHGH
jgi:putative FmdB family regulatory protein